MILLNDFKKQWQKIHPLASKSFTRVGENGELILGKEVDRFEKAIATLLNIQFATGCASGLDAIELSLRCLEVGPGDKILTTPLSAFATSLAIIKVGAIPVFVDVDVSGGLNLDLCEQLLEKNENIKCILPVHLYGQPLNLKKLKYLKENFNIPVIEDCAQSILAKYDGELTGTIGELSAISLYPTKNLGCLGDGGIILTNHLDLAKKVNALRNYGQMERYQHEYIGYNSRLDELQAAILNDALLPQLNYFTTQRKQTAKLYLDNIKNKSIQLIFPISYSEPVWHIFPVLIHGSRQNFQDFMLTNGIQTAIHYPTLIPHQPVVQKNKISIKVFGDLSRASFFANQQVSLPIHPFLTQDEIYKIIDCCNQWSN